MQENCCQDTLSHTTFPIIWLIKDNFTPGDACRGKNVIKKIYVSAFPVSDGIDCSQSSIFPQDRREFTGGHLVDRIYEMPSLTGVSARF